MGTITPSDLHFERHHGGVPDIDPAPYSLLIHGMVERPTMFTLADLKRFPAVSRSVSSSVPAISAPHGRPETTPQQLAGLTSKSEWTGVPLATLFREVGVHPKATWFLAEGQDAAMLTRSIPIEKRRRCADRLRAERRSDPPRTGLSRAPVAARLGRQREREMDTPHRAFGSAVHDARGNVEVHGSARQRHGADFQLRDGCALADHLSDLPGDAQPRLGRDQRHRLDRIGKIRARRRQHRRRQDLDAGETAGAGAVDGAHALPSALELDGR